MGTEILWNMLYMLKIKTENEKKNIKTDDK